VTEPLIIGLVLCSAFIHAIWNAQVKGSSDRFATLVAIRCAGTIFGLAILPFVPLPAPASWPFLFGAAACHYVYYTFMLNAYRVGEFSQVYPIARGSAPLLVALLTLIFASEPLPASTLMAIGLMSAGIALLASGGRGIEPVLYALGTGVTIAAYSYLSGRGIRLAGSNLSYMASLEILASLGMVVLGFTKMRTRVVAYLVPQWRTAIIAGVLSVGGYMIALWAMTHASIAGVVALRETSALFGALIGAYVMKEGFGARRIAAAALVVVGIVVYAL
jgi:drug/metabolite transporter (DMT)-like permease